jgi:hypothetical protein
VSNVIDLLSRKQMTPDEIRAYIAERSAFVLSECAKAKGTYVEPSSPEDRTAGAMEAAEHLRLAAAASDRVWNRLASSALPDNVIPFRPKSERNPCRDSD